MKTMLFHAGAAAALLLAGPVRADDAQTTQPDTTGRNAAHAAMHEAMQQQMAVPPTGAQMPMDRPGLPDQASPTATRAREHAAQMQQQHRQAARERAMKRGAQDAAMARAGTMHGGSTTAGTHRSGNGMMGEAGAEQEGAGMMRTGDMHGGSDGMMPSGGGMNGGGGMTGGGQTGGSGGSGGGMMGK